MIQQVNTGSDNPADTYCPQTVKKEKSSRCSQYSSGNKNEQLGRLIGSSSNSPRKSFSSNFKMRPRTRATPSSIDLISDTIHLRPKQALNTTRQKYQIKVTRPGSENKNHSKDDAPRQQIFNSNSKMSNDENKNGI